MKIGVTQIILGKLTLDETLQLCRDAGYEALELVFSPEGDPNVDMSDDEVRGVKTRCDNAGIEISSAIARYDNRGNFLSRDPAEREAGMKSLRRA
ncbi:MAG: TIM barrel protein, partial [Gemmatimonadota bacterium]|nr:TIM barrel protein [Gemmatimonadota bacterium]